MVRWDADADRLLLLAFITAVPIQLTPETAARVAAAFPPDPVTRMRPTAKAITERIYRMKSMIKAFGSAEGRRAKKKSEQVKVGHSGAAHETPSKTQNAQVPDAAITPNSQVPNTVGTPNHQPSTMSEAPNHQVTNPTTPKIHAAKSKEPKANKKQVTKRKRSRDDDDSDDDRDYEPLKSKCTREAKALKKENPDFQRNGKNATASRKRVTKRVCYSEPEAVSYSEPEAAPSVKPEVVKNEPLSEFSEAPHPTLESHPAFSQLPDSAIMQHVNTAAMNNGMPYGMDHRLHYPTPFQQPIAPGYAAMNSYVMQNPLVNADPQHLLPASYTVPTGQISGYLLNNQGSRRRDSVVGQENHYSNYAAGYVAPNVHSAGGGNSQYAFDSQLSSIAPTMPGNDGIPTAPLPAPPAEHTGPQLDGLSRSTTWSSPGSGDHMSSIAGLPNMGMASTPSPDATDLMAAVKTEPIVQDQSLSLPSDFSAMFEGPNSAESDQFIFDSLDLIASSKIDDPLAFLTDGNGDC